MGSGDEVDESWSAGSGIINIYVYNYFISEKSVFKKLIYFKIINKLKITLLNKSSNLNQIKWINKLAIFKKFKNNRD